MKKKWKEHWCKCGCGICCRAEDPKADEKIEARQAQLGLCVGYRLRILTCPVTHRSEQAEPLPCRRNDYGKFSTKISSTMFQKYFPQDCPRLFERFLVTLNRENE